MVQTILGRGKIDGKLCMNWSPLYHYWKHIDCNCVDTTQWRQLNDSVGDGRSIIKYTKNNDTPHFNWKSEEEKCCGMVGTAHAVSHTKTRLYGTVSETFDLLRKERKCIFAMNNRYWWNTGAQLRTQIEILEWG